MNVNLNNSQINNVGRDQHNVNVYHNTIFSAFTNQGLVLASLRPIDRSAYYVPPCLPGTRQWMFDRISGWLDDPRQPNILWLSGGPGAGKSTIASTLVSQLREKRRLGSSFFCKRGDAALGDPSAFWRTIAFDLAKRDEVFADKLIKNVKDQMVDLTRADIQSHFRYLVGEPLTEIYGLTTAQVNTTERKWWPFKRYKRKTQEAPTSPPPVIVLDALDECGLDVAQSTQRSILMDTITSWSYLDPSLKLLVTSRDHQIPPSFRKVCLHISLETGELVAPETNFDIQTFFERRFAAIRSNFPSLQSWPSPSVIQELTNRAAGLFIWADTVVRFLEQGFPEQQLNRILSNTFRYEGDTIDQLYLQILRVSFPNPDVLAVLRRVVGAIILAKTPLDRSTLIYFIGNQENESSIDFILSRLSSVILIRGPNSRIHLSHLSFAEFMCDSKRCPEEFLVDSMAQNRVMALSCLQVMRDGLRFNICNITTSYRSNDDLQLGPRIGEAISPYLQYACCFWAEHLGSANIDATLADEVRDFLSVRLLYWLEVLSLIKKTDVALRSLTLVEKWCRPCQDIAAFARDGGKFAASFSSVIAQSVPHIYLSALPFAPRDSIVSRQYLPQYPKTLSVPTGKATDWSTILNVPMSQTRRVTSVAISHDGGRVVSGSEDMVICIWDTETGEAICSPFEGHTGQVRSVTFSHDGRRVLSASDDRTVRIWDVETGKTIVLLEGHAGFVRSAAFSDDSRRVVSGSDDKTIRIWDAEADEHASIIFEGHSDRIFSVAFSPDGNHIVSGAADKTSRIWNTKTGTSVSLEHPDWVFAVAISKDSKRLVTGSADRTIRIWGVETGRLICEPIKGHTGFIRSVAISPDRKHVISGSDDRTIWIWDAETGKPACSPYQGHTGFVRSVTFSHDGKRIVSASDDKTIHLWDAETSELNIEGSSALTGSVAFSYRGKCVISGLDDEIIHEWVPETDKRVMLGPDARTIRVWNAETSERVLANIEGHTDFIRSVAFSRDGKTVVSGSNDKTICIWDIETGHLRCAPLNGHTDHVYSVAFSNDDSWVISGSADRTIRVWNAKTGGLIGAPFKGHTDHVHAVAISGDGKRIISASADGTIRVWNAETGNLMYAPLEGHTAWVRAIAISPDGKLIASGSDDTTLSIWDAATGARTRESLRGHTRWVTSVVFSHDSKLVASGSGDMTVRIWDVETGRPIGAPFEGHTDFVRSVAFSHDNHRVVSGSGDETIHIWDTTTGKPIRALKGHVDFVSCVAFSPDDKRLVSVSKDMVIRVWDVEEREVPSSTSNVTFRDDLTMVDGWILGEKSELLFWVPPTHRTALWRPSNVCVIGKNSTKLDVSHFVHGLSWQCCREASRCKKQELMAKTSRHS